MLRQTWHSPVELTAGLGATGEVMVATGRLLSAGPRVAKQRWSMRYRRVEGTAGQQKSAGERANRATTLWAHRTGARWRSRGVDARMKRVWWATKDLNL